MEFPDYIMLTPADVYNGLVDSPNEQLTRLRDFIHENKRVNNSYIQLLADKVRWYGKREAKRYAQLMGAEYRHFDGAMRCLTGMTAHRWINEYLHLAACDLVAQTSFSFKKIGAIMGISSSSFSQFFRAYEGMQPWEYRSLKTLGKKHSFFYP